MTRFIGAGLAALLAFGFVGFSTSKADDEKKDAKSILDKAIKALGGEEKLKAFDAATWKSKGKISINGNESEITTSATIQGMDRYRGEFEAEFNGEKFKAVTVLNDKKGWRKFNDMAMELDEAGLANEKRRIYLQILPLKLLPLTDKAYKAEVIGDLEISGKPAVGIKAIGPDGKDFKLYFDKESGLPVRLIAVVPGFMGDEYTQETNFSNYKEFEGIQRPTKFESKRDGEAFLSQELTEFKALKAVDAKQFDEP